MSIDWTEAPDDATHWDIRGAVWCKHLYFWCYGRWNYEFEIHDLAEDRYTPRPAEPATTAWDGTGLPPRGTICECLFNDGWVKVVVLSVNGDEAWVCRPRGSHIVSKGLGNEFRPIRTQAKTERTQLLKTLNQLRGETDMGVIADAIIEMGFTLNS
jgi:hypothetical protein